LGATGVGAVLKYIDDIETKVSDNNQDKNAKHVCVLKILIKVENTIVETESKKSQISLIIPICFIL